MTDGNVVKEQLTLYNSDNFNQGMSLLVFHLPFVIYTWNAKKYNRLLISACGCDGREINR